VQPGVRDPEQAHARWAALPRSYESRPDFVTRVPGGRVDMRAQIVLTADGRHYVQDRITPAEDELREERIETLDVDEPVVAVMAGSPRAWFHFWPETAARAVLFRQACPGLRARLLLPQADTAFRRAALELLGFGAEDVLEVPGDRLVRAPEVYLPSTAQLPGGRLAPRAMRRLRGLLATRAGGPRRRIYATRQHERRRRVSNGPELDAALEALGFEPVVPHRLPLEAQIELFGQAEAVVGLHGGALTNMLFAPDDCALVELMPETADRARRQLFWNLSAIAGQRYAQVACGVSRDNERGALNVDVHVDPAHLSGIVELLLPSRRAGAG
jgi:capsular polysaccharide biosynthesis protein